MRSLILPVLGILASLPAFAVEVEFEGSTRARARLFNDLSLNRDLVDSSGTQAYVQHRLWLKPRFLINDHLAVFTEFRGLDGVLWGQSPTTGWDPVTGTAYDAVFSDDLAPALAQGAGDLAWDDAGALRSFALWRAWAEVDTNYGRFAVGRMPLHWGLGLWQNHGLGLTSEYGDTADRVQWQHVVDDVWVMLALDLNDSGVTWRSDEMISAQGAVGYRSEKLDVGFTAQYRSAADPAFGLFTGDAATDYRAGTMRIQAEVLGQSGTGDLASGANDVTVTAWGAALDAEMDNPNLGFGLVAAFASGDTDDTDDTLHTFRFDPDFDVGMILFEQPMPVLAAAAITEENGGRSYDQTLLGPAVTNAILLKPRVWRALTPSLDLEASLLWARTAAIPESYGDRGSYGTEMGVALHYQAWDHLRLQAGTAVFLPGSYFANYVDSEGTYEGFEDPVYGGQLLGRIDF